MGALLFILSLLCPGRGRAQESRVGLREAGWVLEGGGLSSKTLPNPHPEQVLHICLSSGSVCWNSQQPAGASPQAKEGTVPESQPCSLPVGCGCQGCQGWWSRGYSGAWRDRHRLWGGHRAAVLHPITPPCQLGWRQPLLQSQEMEAGAQPAGVQSGYER